MKVAGFAVFCAALRAHVGDGIRGEGVIIGL